ncbi:MAG TPA: DNA mismatch repair protein MutS [Polyangia bacterium]|nr:DNA mismatch repair protein MutS [Polyangia bacterium]
MKVRLLHRDRDFDARQPPPWNAEALTQDLALGTLLDAMAGEDHLVRDVSRAVLLAGAGNDIDMVVYRQAVLKDALDNRAAVRELYALTGETLEGRRKRSFGSWMKRPASALYTALDVMDLFATMLRRLRDLARRHAARFTSEGFTSLFSMLERELSDEYLAVVEAHLKALKFDDGALVSGHLGPGNRGDGYILRQPRKDDRSWLQRLLERDPPALTYRIPERDDIGARALSDLRDRSLYLVATALTRSAEHVTGFFKTLRTELAFYIGCLALEERLRDLGEPATLPRPSAAGARSLAGRAIYDPSLALESKGHVVGNDLDARGRDVVIITGANRGGKSSFLQALGLAQLMMEAGMFVAAEAFEGELSAAVLTHYKREEDAGLRRGKFDEELARMSEIADHVGANATLLCNESFAATNEREGSEIARQVVSAFEEKGVRVIFVTHMHTFAKDFYDRRSDRTLFLRAERLDDGTRTFKLAEGEPLATSHGKDLYRRIFA